MGRIIRPIDFIIYIVSSPRSTKCLICHLFNKSYSRRALAANLIIILLLIPIDKYSFSTSS